MWKLTILDTSIAVLITVAGIVFGYGVLNQRVEALEKEQTSVETIRQDVIKIKEDVSFIKGKLERD
jgi:hypothetical protein